MGDTAVLGKPLGGEASWIGVGRGTLLKEHVKLGMEGKGREGKVHVAEQRRGPLICENGSF